MVNENSGVETKGPNQASPNTLDCNYPLFFSLSDVSDIQIISFQLTCVENFSIWFWAICITLLGRNKLGIVDGICSKDQFSTDLGNY